MAPNTPGIGAMAAKPLRLKAARLQREGDLAGAFKAYEEAVALAHAAQRPGDLLSRHASAVGPRGVAGVSG